MPHYANKTAFFRAPRNKSKIVYTGTVLGGAGHLNFQDHFCKIIDVVWRKLCLISIAGLTRLKELDLSQRKVKDIKPLAELINLQTLNIRQTEVSDLEPIKSLKKLGKLHKYGCENITNKNVENQQKALPEPEINR